MLWQIKKQGWSRRLATLLEGVGHKKVKVNSKNVLKSFVDVNCCKVGVNYGFKSELKHQSWCRDKKRCRSKVLKVLKLKKKTSNYW